MEQRDATTTLSFSSTVENVSLEVPPIVPMPTVAPNPPPLQVYYRRTQAPLTTPPIDPPTSSPTTNALLPLLPTHKYPIALCKSIWFTRNDNPKYAFTLKCDHLTPSYFSRASSSPTLHSLLPPLSFFYSTFFPSSSSFPPPSPPSSPPSLVTPHFS